DREHVVHARRLEEFDLHRAHHEGEARSLGLCLREQAHLIDAEQAKIVAAPALHEAQIVGVVDDAGEIGVLVEDRHRHDMTAAADLAVQRESSHLRNSASMSMRPSITRTIVTASSPTL